MCVPPRREKIMIFCLFVCLFGRPELSRVGQLSGSHGSLSFLTDSV